MKISKKNYMSLAAFVVCFSWLSISFAMGSDYGRPAMDLRTALIMEEIRLAGDIARYQPCRTFHPYNATSQKDMEKSCGSPFCVKHDLQAKSNFTSLQSQLVLVRQRLKEIK